jgi:hypothetical protein
MSATKDARTQVGYYRPRPDALVLQPRDETVYRKQPFTFVDGGAPAAVTPARHRELRLAQAQGAESSKRMNPGMSLALRGGSALARSTAAMTPGAAALRLLQDSILINLGSAAAEVALEIVSDALAAPFSSIDRAISAAVNALKGVTGKDKPVQEQLVNNLPAIVADVDKKLSLEAAFNGMARARRMMRNLGLDPREASDVEKFGELMADLGLPDALDLANYAEEAWKARG